MPSTVPPTTSSPTEAHSLCQNSGNSSLNDWASISSTRPHSTHRPTVKQNESTPRVTGGAEGCTARSTRQDGEEREYKWGSCVTSTEAWPSKVWARALLCNATSQGSSFVLPGSWDPSWVIWRIPCPFVVVGLVPSLEPARAGSLVASLATRSVSIAGPQNPSLISLSWHL